jgi:hypothetical protein
MSLSLPPEILRAPVLQVQQRRELAELFGFETRNKYSIETERGELLAYAAEQQRGILGFLLRQFLGHWRRFEIHFFDRNRRPLFRAVHPFRWIFARLEVVTPEGERLGALQQRFSILSKRFDVEGPLGEVFLQVRSPVWRIWTFPFTAGDGRERAVIEKRWSGLLREAFTDGDRFRIRLVDSELTPEERALLLAAGIFIDLRYFEAKAR